METPVKGVAKVDPPEKVMCKFCLHPMQIATDVVNGNEITARSFICGCRGEIFRWTWHRGQS